MKISSPAFDPNGPIPSKYTCDDQNISPPLIFSKVPEEAKTLVLICEDPDALEETWIHWTIWNIHPKTAEIKEGAVPEGSTQGLTSFRQVGYGGPCPPSGTHRYFFKLYALDTSLDSTYQAKKEDLEKAMKGHIIARAELVGTYSRNK